MPQNLAGLRQLISRVKPWVGVAVILAVVLLGYFLVQGGRYWQASDDVSALDREILNLENSTRLMILSGIAASEELEAQPTVGQRTIEELNSLFGERSAESLMTEVAAMAVEAAVELTAINPSPSELRVLGELQYHVRPIAISVGGSTANLFRFLSLLHENIPVVSVSDLTISALGVSPLAQMLLRFYLSPSPIEGAEENS